MPRIWVINLLLTSSDKYRSNLIKYSVYLYKCVDLKSSLQLGKKLNAENDEIFNFFSFSFFTAEVEPESGGEEF